jgi:hypothetical protein
VENLKRNGSHENGWMYNRSIQKRGASAMMRTCSRTALTIALSLYPGYVSSVHAVSLSSLVSSNGTIQQGDKLFSNFSFDPIVGNCLVNPCGPANTGTIDVQGIVVAGQNGLRFTGPFFEARQKKSWVESGSGSLPSE